MDSAQSAPPGKASPPDAHAADRRRELWFRVVFLGMVILIVGFSAALLGQAEYPCIPAAGSDVAPPLAACAVALSPWLGLAFLGFVLALVAYFRVR